MQWAQQFEIIKDKIDKSLRKEGQRFSFQNAADYLGIGIGKVRAWDRGQRPSADDLEAIGRKLGFCAHWLLFREGDPEAGAASAAEAPANSARPIADPLVERMLATVALLKEHGASPKTIQQAIMRILGPAPSSTEYPTVEEPVPNGFGEAAEPKASSSGRRKRSKTGS